jgi:hypothetical protein
MEREDWEKEARMVRDKIKLDWTGVCYKDMYWIKLADTTILWLGFL